MRLQLLKDISDEKIQELLAMIANGKYSKNIVNVTRMTRKQYYLRLSNLIRADLVKRKNGKYTITNFGKVIY
jgi:predicted transcriptional regulator